MVLTRRRTSVYSASIATATLSPGDDSLRRTLYFIFLAFQIDPSFESWRRAAAICDCSARHSSFHSLLPQPEKERTIGKGCRGGVKSGRIIVCGLGSVCLLFRHHSGIGNESNVHASN